MSKRTAPRTADIASEKPSSDFTGIAPASVGGLRHLKATYKKPAVAVDGVSSDLSAYRLSAHRLTTNPLSLFAANVRLAALERPRRA